MSDSDFNARCGAVIFLCVLAWLFMHTIFGEWVYAVWSYPWAAIVWTWSLLPWWGWIGGFLVLCACTGEAGGKMLTGAILLGLLGVVFYFGYRMVDIALPMIIGSWLRTH